MKKRRPTQNQGFVLIASFLFISVLSIFSLALFAQGNTYRIAAERNQNRMGAFNMAEGGLDWAIRQLEIDGDYRDDVKDAGTAGLASGYVSMNTVDGTFQGGYGLLAEWIQSNPNIVRVTVAGHAPVNSNAAAAEACPVANSTGLPRAYECRSIQAYINLASSSPFQSAVYAESDFDMMGPLIDSYDSRTDPDYQNPGSNAEVRTDSTAEGAITLGGNATLKGNATVGPGGDPDTVISLGPQATITGNKLVASSPLDFDDPTVPAGAVDLGNTLKNVNHPKPIDAGTYVVDSLKISGIGKLMPTTSGGNSQLVIYSKGAVEIGGNGIATVDKLPPNLIIYILNDSTVKLSGGGNFYGGVYAPDSQVRNSGNGDLFGAIVSEIYDQTGNGDVHFDEAMKDVLASTGATYQADLLSWLEKHTTA